MAIQKQIIKVIIADDHKIFLEGLTSLLKEFKEIMIIAIATNGDEVLKLMEHNIVDIIITDINMPGMDGMKLCKEIKKKYPNVNVLALTMHNESGIISNMLKNGITGYILKDTGKEELFLAIKSVIKGELFLAQSVKTTLTESMNSGKKQKSNLLPELSDREIEILKLIAAEYTQQQIADKLFISPHTVIFHRRKLLYKLDVKNTAGLIKCAMDKGLLD